MKTLPKENLASTAMKSRDTEQKNRTELINTVCNAKCSYTITNFDFLYCKILYCISMQNSTVGVALSRDFLVKGTALANTKPICAEMMINRILKLILNYARLLKKMNALKCRTLGVYNARARMLESARAIETQVGSVHCWKCYSFDRSSKRASTPSYSNR